MDFAIEIKLLRITSNGRDQNKSFTGIHFDLISIRFSCFHNNTSVRDLQLSNFYSMNYLFVHSLIELDASKIIFQSIYCLQQTKREKKL